MDGRLATTDLLLWPSPIDPASVVTSIRYLGQPLPKERARVVTTVGRRGRKRTRAFTPERTAKYEESLRNLFRAATKLAPPDGETLFGVRCFFRRSNAIRCDTDNCLKCVKDAANGVVWKDDSQVVEVFGRLWRRCAVPSAEVVVYRV